MQTTARAAFLWLLLAAAPYAAADRPDPAIADTVSPPYVPPKAEVLPPEELLKLINNARAHAQTCGKDKMPAAAPLKWSEALARSAQKHAEDMAEHNYFSHNNLKGRQPYQRNKDDGYTGLGGYENIGRGYLSAQDAVAGWLGSPGHCKNLMNAEISEVGMAHAFTADPRYGNYWVQNFGIDAEKFKQVKGFALDLSSIK
ncbi:MAG: CAP domain-containing protein [Neisseria sp.]|nr:CAP domain-containing protein [Neisseria sp.]